MTNENIWHFSIYFWVKFTVVLFYEFCHFISRRRGYETYQVTGFMLPGCAKFLYMIHTTHSYLVVFQLFSCPREKNWNTLEMWELVKRNVLKGYVAFCFAWFLGFICTCNFRVTIATLLIPYVLGTTDEDWGGTETPVKGYSPPAFRAPLLYH